MNILATLKENHFPEIIDDNAKAKLESMGNVIYRADLNKDTGEKEYSTALQESKADIVMTCWDSPLLTFKVYKENPQLKYLCNMAGEVRPYVDLEVIKAGLIVSNWGNVIAKSVAEGALMMILSALRRTTYFQVEMHVRKGWAGMKQPEGLFYQKVGLLGLGAIACELVKLLQPFECIIYAYDPHVADQVFEKLNVNRLSAIEELVKTCRIISIHAAKTPETFHVIDTNMLSTMEDGGVIVNTARGAIIDTTALIAELKTGRIEAALDVFEEEPLRENSELRGLDNCMLMPHLAGPTSDRRSDMGNFAIANIENFIKGCKILSIVTPEKYELIT